MDGGMMRCKNCGADIDISTAINGVVECEYCLSKFTVPKKEVSPAALSFLRQGEHDLDTCKFDDAYTAYRKAAQYDEKEPEAYWGMALAEFKVQYIKDTVNNRLQPICHEFTDKLFTQNKNYNSALACATEKQKAEYAKKAQEIDYIRSEFLKLKQSGLDYDCFICVKVSRMDGEQADPSKKNWTDDAYDADAIYDLLKRNGYTPFYSEREIRGRTGADYEAMILYALYTSETMLVVCRNEDYLQTPWVKNEYTRFKELVNNKEKENDALTIVYNGSPIERLFGFSGKIQGIDYSRRSADFDIVKFVESHTPLAKARREEEQHKKSEEAELIRRQIEEQKKAQKELEEKLKNLNPNTAMGTTSTVGTLLTRANQEMEARNFEKAKNFFETVLERSPENAAAWLGLLLVKEQCSSVEAILNRINQATQTNFNDLFDIPEDRNFVFAKRYAEGQILKQLNDIEAACKNKINGLLKPINPNAAKFYYRVASSQPENADAWWGHFLCGYSVADESGILHKEEITSQLLTSIHENESFKSAEKYAQGDIKSRIVNFKNKLVGIAENRYDSLNKQNSDLKQEIEALEIQKRDNEKIANRKVLSSNFLFIIGALALVGCLIYAFVAMFYKDSSLADNFMFGMFNFMDGGPGDDYRTEGGFAKVIVALILGVLSSLIIIIPLAIIYSIISRTVFRKKNNEISYAKLRLDNISQELPVKQDEFTSNSYELENLESAINLYKT